MNQPHFAVLLVDCDLRMRQLRQTIFRNREIDVRLATSLPYALTLCRAQKYDLVLLSGQDSEEVSGFCEGLWEAVPKQRIALLEGPPTYLREMKAKHRPTSRQPAQTIQLVQPRQTIFEVGSVFSPLSSRRVKPADVPVSVPLL